jgi:hypothetical protein
MMTHNDKSLLYAALHRGHLNSFEEHRAVVIRQYELADAESGTAERAELRVLARLVASSLDDPSPEFQLAMARDEEAADDGFGLMDDAQ